MPSFYPTGSSRASTQQGISRLLFQIHHDQSAIQDLQKQLSTGRRIERASEDPSAAVRALAAQRGQEFKSQTSENLQAADTILSATESTLAQAQSIITEMRGVAISATSTTLSKEEIDAFSQQLKSGLDQLISISNKKFRDQFIFAGSQVRESPLAYIDDTVQFNANAEDLFTISDYSETVAANVRADDAFGVKSRDIIGTADLNAALTANTPLADLNRGEGVRNSAIRLSDGVEVVELGLSNAHNISDVVDKIAGTTLSGRELSVTIGSAGLNISYADGLGGLLRVGEVGSGSMANDLGINNTTTIGLSPVVGGDLDPVVTEQSRLVDLFGGVGISTNDSFLIRQGDKDYTITTNNLDTVEDLMNRIRQSGAQVAVSLDDSGRFFSLQSTESGSTLTIGENGSTLATQLGIRTFDLDTSLDSLNLGRGLSLNELGDDIVISRSNGSQLSINLSGTKSVSDVLNRINNHVDNQVPTLRVTASLASVGNGLTLSANNGAQPISISSVGGSQAVWGLGLIPPGQASVTGTPTGTTSEISGRDVSGIEVEGIFNSLIRLREAVEAGRPEDIERIAAGLDDDVQRMSLARGLVGTRQQSIESLTDLNAEQQIQLTEAESDELDADLAQVISDLAAREAAMQASLQLIGRASQLSLFDYV